MVKRSNSMIYEERGKLYEFYGKKKVIDLKLICRNIGIKVSGSKLELVERIVEKKGKQDNKAIEDLSSVFRRQLVRKWYSLMKGSIVDVIVNTEDCITLDKLYDSSLIGNNELEDIFFVRENSSVYGFLFRSMRRLINESERNMSDGAVNRVKNPYTNSEFSDEVMNRFRDFEYYNKLLYSDRLYKIEEKDSVNVEKIKTVSQYCVDLFQSIDRLGYYTDINWFMELSGGKLIQLLRELIDIVDYRANLSIEMKNRLLGGRSFYRNSYGEVRILVADRYLGIDKEAPLQYYVLDCMEELLSMPEDKDDKSLVAMYILAALTIVSHDAAVSMPWLLDAVVGVQ